jgi:hypothetical protein
MDTFAACTDDAQVDVDLFGAALRCKVIHFAIAGASNSRHIHVVSTSELRAAYALIDNASYIDATH